mgnify:CR=1 FL=1
MKLTLNHIAPYLPYNLNIYNVRESRIWILDLSTKSLTKKHIGITTVLLANDLFKPVLRPLSDLVEEIEFDGKKFIPLKHLFELYETNQFSSEKHIQRDIKNIGVDIISCKHMKYKYSNKEDFILKYAFDTTNMGTLVYSFTYDDGLHRFAVRNETHEKPLGVAHQLEMFQKLFEWKFDLFELIKNGLAIDINTIKEN